MAGGPSGGSDRRASPALQGFRRSLQRFLGAADGSTAMEYGLIVSIITLGIVVFLRSFGETLSGFFRAVATAMLAS